ncbi:Ubiquitin family protein [Cryptosporidium felis]|nr:Ubiquitin family protein [Cryptosporidium felis]
MSKEGGSSSGSGDEVLRRENPGHSETVGEISGDWNPVGEGREGAENLTDTGARASSSSGDGDLGVTSENFVVVGSSERDLGTENKLQIIVRPLNGRDLTVEASQSSTIRQLKVLIEVKSGIEAINQRLIFRGRCMLDDDTVGRYTRENGAIIHLVPYARSQRETQSPEDSGSRTGAEASTGTQGTEGQTGTLPGNLQNLFASVSGMPTLNGSGVGGFPGAMMFGAIRLDGVGGDSGVPVEAEELMQRVLRTFGDAMNGSGVDQGLVNISSSTGDGRPLNSSISFNTFSFGQAPVIQGFSGQGSTTERTSGNSAATGSAAAGAAAAAPSPQSPNPSEERSRTSARSGGSPNRRSSSASGGPAGMGGGQRNRGPDNLNGNPIGRIGTIVSRIFQAFNQPVTDIIQDGARSERRATQVSGPGGATTAGTTSLGRTGAGAGATMGEVRATMGEAGVTVGEEGVTVGEADEASGTTQSAGAQSSGSAGTNGGPAERTASGGSQDASGRSSGGPVSGLNWAQIATSGGLSGGRTGILPMGRPGLAVATIPISNFSIPITIRATTTSGGSTTTGAGSGGVGGAIPTISFSTSNSASSGGRAGTASTRVPVESSRATGEGGRGGNSGGEPNGLASNPNSSSVGNGDGINSGDSLVSQTFRSSSNHFFTNISNILEDSAAQLQTVASSIREMSGLDSSSSSSSTLPPIPTSVSNRSISGECLASGQTSDYIQHHSRRLYISNEVVHRFLPWDSLNELMGILERDCGWRRPRIVIPPPVDSVDVGPLAIFLSVYLQALSIIQANLMHIQAWQERFARLDIPRLCYTVHMLALISHISAHLGSLLAWLFHNMAQHVEQDALIEGLQWGKSGAEEALSGEALLERDSSGQEVGREAPTAENALQNEESDSQMVIDNLAQDTAGRARSGEEGEIPEEAPYGGTKITNEAVLDSLPKEVREKWESWTGNAQGFSRNVFASFSNRPFSDTYQQGNIFSGSSSFGISRASPANGEGGSGQNSYPTSQELLNTIIHQTEANLNIGGQSGSRNSANLQSEYRSMLIRDLVNLVRSDSDFLSDQDRFPHIRRILSLL